MPETETPRARVLAVATYLRGGGDRLAAASTLERFADELPTADRRPALTTKQAKVLAFIREHVAANGCAPTLQEIADHFGYRSISTAHEHLTSLEAAGYLSRVFNRKQGTTLTEVAA